MKIGYFLTVFPSPSETFVAREIRHLQQRGCPVVVFAAAGPSSEGRERMAGVYYRPARMSETAALSVLSLLARHPWGVVKLLMLILHTAVSCPREAVTLLGNLHTIGSFAEHLEQENVAHIHAYFMSWPAAVALGVSVVTGRSFSLGAHARDVFVEAGDVVRKVSRSTFVIACNRQAITHLEGQLSSATCRKLKLIHHGIDIDGKEGCRPKRDRPPPEAGSRILGVGRLIPKKGFADLLQALALLVKRNPQVRLTLIGAGPEQQSLRHLTEELSLHHCVEFLGWQPPASVRQWLGVADVLVVPSVVADDGDRDGIPNVILEAFVAGVPVLATSLPSIGEVIRDRWNGLLVRPGDVPRMASALRRLLADRALGVRLARRAHATVVEHFDIRETTEQLAHLFQGTGRGSHVC